MSTARPWITCHVLDTVAGKPAPNMRVTLAPRFASSASLRFEAKTNADGRVTTWTLHTAAENPELDSLNSLVEHAKQDLKDGDQLTWSLTFQTEEYYGKGKTFWPEVELRFATDPAQEHYHVPLLLGPWSYTTYRGS